MSLSRNLPLILALTLPALAVGCSDPIEPLPPIAEGIFAPMGDIRPIADETQRATFERGEAVARRRFTPAMGLGPSFNVTFCGACHERPVFGGSAARYRNFLLVEQELSDGSSVKLGVNGVQVQFDLDRTRFPTDPGANRFATRSPIPFFGVGLLAEIPEAAILVNADPDDADGDGISGRPNIDRGFVGRFGRKAQTVTIEGFIRGPLNNHLGITSNPLSDELREQLPVPSPRFQRDVAMIGGVGSRTQAQASAPDEPVEDSDGVPDPELSDQDLFDLVSWSMLLAAPEPEELNEQGLRGQLLFAEANCTGCHVPGLAGPRGTVPAYSDLLLHYMGERLADGFKFGEASGGEFRTQPLWGLAATGPFLHDGRADTIDEAIVEHGGEAGRSRDAYLAMTDDERAAIHEFLMSLGGRSQASTGLLHPDAPIPSEGPGAPLDGLSETELVRFAEGRTLFDRDEFLSEGLGPIFNGDSCRACHFDPVVGGAGPADVDVIRAIRFDGDGYTAPQGGTIAHRFSGGPVRPRFMADANVIERRQTPTLLGLGVLERVPRETILALADPDDLDGDGVRGVAHVLPDGRLGRFGWKADVPSVHEFVRDAMSAELGVTVPPEEGATYGAGADIDSVPDPEISADEIESIRFFIAMLAPPTPQSTDATLEAQGAEAFASVGCATCHTTLALADGTPVNAYTDLLLHDVADADYIGVPSMNAPPRHFRTAPLWGVRDTAPYMHNAAASTLEEAIALHAGEAEMSRMGYEALTADAREALLAFLTSL